MMLFKLLRSDDFFIFQEPKPATRCRQFECLTPYIKKKDRIDKIMRSRDRHLIAVT